MAIIKTHASTEDILTGLNLEQVKAVIHKNNGWTNREIAEALFLDEETVSTHVDEYFTNKKLKPENGGSQGSLNQQQISNSR